MAIFSWFRTILNGTATVLFRCVLRCFRLVFLMGPPRKQINPSMASSSSSSQPTPPSSSFQSWKHDVFLSFRGTDTRNTFVDHLYAAFVRQGIDTYKDDQTLPRGETIGPSLLKAIEESQIAVIVFSENYADSSWCLDELAHIMKCKDERGLIVIPLFYHIDPSEVRKQKGKYGEALAKYESENRDTDSWREALVDVGNLSGHVANGPEIEFIKEVVDTVSNRLFVAISREDEDLVGIGDRLQDLKSKMEMESDGIVMVGIWGVGGGGKTTLAYSLYKEISSKFDGCCFVENVREESSKFGLKKLQEDILSLVLEQKKRELVGDVGSLIKSRFRRKKVLMVLDDVDHANQLKALAGSHDWFGVGSRIVITTRDNLLLYAHNVNVIYNISLLNDDEAIKLFCKHAVGHGRPIEDYEMLAKDVVSYAGGLPLALIVLGSFLCDKDKSEWTSALAKLKDIPDIDIMEKLKISYNGLDNMQKELFLDIACFFRGYKKDEAMGILDACGFHPIIGVKVLIQKALITVSQDGWIDMHDLIQEMGHYIVRGENLKNPEKHSRIWQREDILSIFAMDSMMENDRIEALRIEWLQDELPYNLPEVVANMKKLRWISCAVFRATSLPREFQPMKLCYLNLEGSLLEQLWEGNKHLPNLKVLDLCHSSNLITTPDFEGLPCLERMILKGCESLKEVHPSIGYHERLIYLNMEHCTSLEIFPPIIRMKKLETLILSDCYRLCKFPEFETSMDNLVELSLRGSGIEIVPSSMGQHCTNLLSLDLSHCWRLQSIEGNFRLKRINIERSDQLKIPAEGLFDVECCLRVLSVCNTYFKKFHQGMVSMKVFGFSCSLRRLNLTNCNLVDGDISSVFCKELSNLEALDLSRNKFSRLHSSLTQLPHLKFLDLSLCANLVELPDLPSSIAILIAIGCDSLQIVGDLPTNLKWLWKVAIYTCPPRGDGKRVVQSLLPSMLEGNAVEDYFICLYFDDTNILRSVFGRKTNMLELPSNWYNEFSGFLIYMNDCDVDDIIIIKDAIGREDEDDVLEVSDDGIAYEDDVLEVSDDGIAYEDDVLEVSNDDKTAAALCYISFGSLRNTTWWNSTHNTISFFLPRRDANLKVELVRNRNDGDSIERPKDAANFSEFWDDKKTVRIIHDTKSFIEIVWFHVDRSDMFRSI